MNWVRNWLAAPWNISPRRTFRRPLLLTTLEDRAVPSTTLWTQRGGDSGHTSYVDVSFNPTTLTEAWTRPLGFTQSGTGSWYERAVAIDGQNVYRTDLEGYAPSGTYHVFAFNLQTGAEQWHRTFQGNAFAGVGEPSVAGGIVYVNRAGHSGISGGTDADLPRIYGLNAQTGATILERRYAAQWGSNERPAIGGNRLVAWDGYYGGFSSFDTATLNRHWNQSASQYELPLAAFDDEYIYAYGNGVFNPATGVRLRTITHTQLQLRDPMVSTSGRILFEGHEPVSGSAVHGISAYDGDTHSHQWTFNTNTWITGKAVGNGVVAVTAGQSLYLLNEATGAVLHTWQAPAALGEDIVLTRTHAFVQSSAGGPATVHAIDLATGQPVWQYVHVPITGGSGAMEIAFAGDHLVLSHHLFVKAFRVGAGNQPPDAVDDGASTDEDQPVAINVLGNDTDADGNPLSITAVSQPAHGTVVQNGDGTITYTPAANYHGADWFTYTISDGNGGTDTATVNLIVNAVNDVPIAQGDVYSTNEDTPLVVNIPGVLGNDSDVDGDALSAILVSGPTHGILALTASGSFTYQPAANYNGTDSFTYLASDGTAESVPVTVQLTIHAVNDAPGFTGGPNQTVREDSGVRTVDGWATSISSGPPDETGQALTFLVSTDNDGLFASPPTISPSGTLSFTPAANASGVATVTVRLRDDGGTANGGIDTSAAQTFTIEVVARPDVANVEINRGEVQRSRVTEIAVTFDMIVDPALLAGAFTLTRTSDGLSVGTIHVSTTVLNGRTTATLTFSGAGTEFGSLADGLWTLRVNAARVQASNGEFMAADATTGLHRLFGDADGDRDVDSLDEQAFNAAFGNKSNQIGYVSYFDFDQDVNRQGWRDIDKNDRTQFRQRLGRSI